MQIRACIHELTLTIWAQLQNERVDGTSTPITNVSDATLTTTHRAQSPVPVATYSDDAFLRRPVASTKQYDIGYQARKRLTTKALRHVLDKWWPKIGYVGAQVCAAFQTLPVGELAANMKGAHPVPGPPTAYQLQLFNGLICPNFVADNSTCDPNRKRFDGSPLFLGRIQLTCTMRVPNPNRFAPSMVSMPPQWSGPDGTVQPERMPGLMLNHIWGCIYYHGRSGGAAVQCMKLRHQSLADSEFQAGIHHAHLPRRACDAVRQAGLDSNMVWIYHQLRDYFAVSDASDRGRHGLLHEFGEYYANRFRSLYENSAIDASWEVFAIYYLSVAPLHAFLSNIMEHSADVGGESLIRWVPRWCAHLYNASSTLGKAHETDVHRLLFSECAHGAGHGAFKLRNLSCAQRSLML